MKRRDYYSSGHSSKKRSRSPSPDYKSAKTKKNLFIDLLNAINENSLDKVKATIFALQKERIPIYTKWYDYGENALHIAAKTGHREIAEYLLSIGFSPTSESDQGFTAIHSAAYYNRLNVLQLFCSKTTNIPALLSKQKKNILHSVLSGHSEKGKEVFDFILSKFGEDKSFVNQQDIRGNTPLHCAVGLGGPHVCYFIKQLLEAGADPTITNDHDDTAEAIAHRQKLGLITGAFEEFKYQQKKKAIDVKLNNLSNSNFVSQQTQAPVPMDLPPHIQSMSQSKEQIHSQPPAPPIQTSLIPPIESQPILPIQNQSIPQMQFQPMLPVQTQLMPQQISPAQLSLEQLLSYLNPNLTTSVPTRPEPPAKKSKEEEFITYSIFAKKSQSNMDVFRKHYIVPMQSNIDDHKKHLENKLVEVNLEIQSIRNSSATLPLERKLMEVENSIKQMLIDIQNHNNELNNARNSWQKMVRSVENLDKKVHSFHEKKSNDTLQKQVQTLIDRDTKREQEVTQLKAVVDQQNKIIKLLTERNSLPESPVKKLKHSESAPLLKNFSALNADKNNNPKTNPEGDDSQSMNEFF